MFVDRVTVKVAAGTGGSGASSFARFKYKPKGGPDGGDGGRGGSVYVRGDANLSTLLDYRYRNQWKAERGEHGKGANKTGASSDDLYLPVPPGTTVINAGTGEVLGEILKAGDTLLVAKGGRGGRGNTQFATSTNRAPREWEPGEEGEELELELVLKLIADVGLVGEPNAGKSTLLASITSARPRIGDYPFTTLEPNLGVVGLGEHRTIVVADIPGIIEDAHLGKGLGIKFLQHVERTRVLAYLLPLDVEDLPSVYQRLRHEIAEYSAELRDRVHLVVITKSDLLPPDAEPPVIDAPDAAGVVVISGVSRAGLPELKEQLWSLVNKAREQDRAEEAADQLHAPG